MKNFCLIFSLIDPWETNPRKPSTIAYADNIEKMGGVIICIEPPILSIYTLFKYPGRLLKFLKGDYKFRKVHGNIYAFCPFTIEHIYISHKFYLLKKLNLWLVRNQIIKKLLKLKISKENVSLVLHRPELHFMKNLFNGTKMIYECQDDFLSTPNKNDSKVKGNELREKNFVIDCVFAITTAERLYDRLKAYNFNTFLLENGFSEKVFRNRIKLKAKSKPFVAGYIGHIRDWIDFEIVEYLLINNPDVIFEFSGRIQNEVKNIFSDLCSKYKNIIGKGDVNYIKYPEVLNGFDIGLIPFTINRFMSCSNPNKLFEYFGSGLPVISTDIGDIKSRYAGYAYIANTKEEFNDNLQLLKNFDNNEYLLLRDKIKKMSAEHTWEKNAESFSALLTEHIFEQRF